MDTHEHDRHFHRAGSAVALLAGLLFTTAAAATVVSGQVTRPGGQGVFDVDVDFIDRDTGLSVPLVNDNTDVLGFYAVAVPIGDYDIRFKPPVGVRLAGAEERGVSVQGGALGLNVLLESGWFVTGRVVTESLVPVAGVDLDFVDLTDGGVLYTPHDSTDLLGNFQVVVTPGSYDIQFEPAIGPALVPLQMEAIGVAADVILADVVLASGIHLAGDVVTSTGLPVSSVRVLTLQPPTGVEIFNIRNTTDFLGHFDLVVLPADYSLQFLPVQGDPFLPRLLAGVVVSTDMTLQPVDLEGGVVFAGRVRDTDSNDVEGADLDMISLLTGVKVFTPKDNTDKDGQYTITVRPGIYDVTYDPPAGLGLAPARTTGVILTADLSQPEVNLVPGFAVSGLVQNGAGGLVAAADLDFIQSPGGVEIFTSSDDTDAAGVFAVMVPAGPYDIEFSPPPGSGVGERTLLGQNITGATHLGVVTLPPASPALPAGVTPPAGSAAGGTLVTVTGTGFAPGVRVRIGGRTLSQIQRLDGLTVQGVTRSVRVGAADVEVTNPGAAPGVLPGGFLLVAPVDSVQLGVSLGGPLSTDILLDWGLTGQTSYTIFASSSAGVFGDAEVLDVRTGTGFLHQGGAVSASTTFYLVQ